MIPILAAAGHRVICPDLVGFGRSDKPTRREDHSYARHVEWMRALAFDVLDLHNVTLVGQDWGGLIGLRLAAEHPERFARLVVANTGLPTGDSPCPISGGGSGRRSRRPDARTSAGSSRAAVASR